MVKNYVRLKHTKKYKSDHIRAVIKVRRGISMKQAARELSLVSNTIKKYVKRWANLSEEVLKQLFDENDGNNSDWEELMSSSCCCSHNVDVPGSVAVQNDSTDSPDREQTVHVQPQTSMQVTNMESDLKTETCTEVDESCVPKENIFPPTDTTWIKTECLEEDEDAIQSANSEQRFNSEPGNCDSDLNSDDSDNPPDPMEMVDIKMEPPEEMVDTKIETPEEKDAGEPSKVTRRPYRRRKPLKQPADPKWVRSEVINGRTTHFCRLCAYKTVLPNHLRNHILTHTGDKPFSCPECSRSFNRADNLKTHMAIHAGIKRFSCPDCPYRTNQEVVLKRHRRQHTGERPFLCSLCGATFTQSFSLKMHMVKHSEEKTHQCLTCSYSCKWRNSMKRHKTTNGQDKPHKCQFVGCSYEGNRKANLNMHVLRIHRGKRSSETGNPSALSRQEIRPSGVEEAPTFGEVTASKST